MNSNPLAIGKGEVFTPKERFSPGLVIIEEGKISYAGPWEEKRIPAKAELLDAEGKIIAPGLLDIHIHGSAGADFFRDGKAGLEKMSRFLASRGVTSFLPAAASAPIEELEAAVKAAGEAAAQPPSGAQVLGIHLEGPYLSPGRKGAHAPEHLRNPDLQEIARLVELGGGTVKMVTLAPELQGAMELIHWLRERNIVISLGHSEASYEQAREAIEAGADHACHLFNAMPHMDKREPGITGALLEDERVYAELIADLVHIHPMMLKTALQIKGPQRSLLISDAIEAAGMPDGAYAFSGQKVVVNEGAARLKNGALAGSTLTLDKAVKNVVEALGIPLQSALTMASQTPANSLRLPNKGRLAAGADGDVVIFGPNLSVSAAIIGGEVVFQQGVKS
jgi:N-acetylglucosamine-6-phosphate deacetylase